jgi:hypothetical protein
MSQWRYKRSGYGSKNADFDIVSEAGGRVASTPYEDKARLIAAAPRMLTELRAAYRVLVNLPGNEELLSDMDAAIKQATE